MDETTAALLGSGVGVDEVVVGADEGGITTPVTGTGTATVGTALPPNKVRRWCVLAADGGEVSVRSCSCW